MRALTELAKAVPVLKIHEARPTSHHEGETWADYRAGPSGFTWRRGPLLIKRILEESLSWLSNRELADCAWELYLYCSLWKEVVPTPLPFYHDGEITRYLEHCGLLLACLQPGRRKYRNNFGLSEREYAYATRKPGRSDDHGTTLVFTRFGGNDQPGD